MFDALDECSSDTLNVALSLVRQLKDYGIKIFCTSRPFFTDVRTRLGAPSEIPVEPKDEDVREYLSMRLSKEWTYGDESKQIILDSLTRITKTSRKYVTSTPVF